MNETRFVFADVYGYHGSDHHPRHPQEETGLSIRYNTHMTEVDIPTHACLV